MEEKTIIRRHALAQRVLAVAVLHCIKKEKIWEIFDWAVYIDAVPGEDYNKEMERVSKYGTKTHKRIAEVLFPRFDIKKYK